MIRQRYFPVRIGDQVIRDYRVTLVRSMAVAQAMVKLREIVPQVRWLADWWRALLYVIFEIN